MLTFDERGLLPAGDHPLTFDQLRESILVRGPENSLDILGTLNGDFDLSTTARSW